MLIASCPSILGSVRVGLVSTGFPSKTIRGRLFFSSPLRNCTTVSFSVFFIEACPALHIVSGYPCFSPCLFISAKVRYTLATWDEVIDVKKKYKSIDWKHKWGTGKNKKEKENIEAN